MLLDIVEVPKSHTGENLAIAFANVLEVFSIKDKVSRISERLKVQILTYRTDP
jgi:hypothetical protein